MQSLSRPFPASAQLPQGRALSKRIVKVVCLGLVSLTMYMAVLLNQDAVTRYYTSGGVFAGLVIITAIAFALVYGTFAGNVLDGLLFKEANREKGGH